MSLNFIEILPNFDLFLHFIYMFILNHHILFLDLLYLIHLLISFIIIMFLCLTFIKKVYLLSALYELYSVLLYFIHFTLSN